MPVTLTTAYDVGVLDSDYTDIKVTNIEIDVIHKVIFITCYHGYMDGGNWVKGKLERDRHAIEGSDFDTMIEALSTTDEKVYDGVARLLYQWLIDKGHFVGSIT